MLSLLDERLCTQTVTLYRRQGSAVQRIVLEGCYLEMEQRLSRDALGQQREYRFLLIVPGQEQMVFPGDRILEGIGPEELSWALTSGFAQVEYAKVCCWEGSICHTEAGRKVR